jgi:S-phase kinase-associated protein 1
MPCIESCPPHNDCLAHSLTHHSLSSPLHRQESREGECFEVPIKVARLSQMIDEMFDEDEDMDDKKVPLPNVSSDVLRKVIEFGKHYQEEQMTPIQTPLKSSNIDDLVQKWYAEFVDLPQKSLFELVAAANYLNIKPLLDLTVLAVSILIKVSEVMRNDATSRQHRMWAVPKEGGVTDPLVSIYLASVPGQIRGRAPRNLQCQQ